MCPCGYSYTITIKLFLKNGNLFMCDVDVDEGTSALDEETQFQVPGAVYRLNTICGCARATCTVPFTQVLETLSTLRVGDEKRKPTILSIAHRFGLRTRCLRSSLH